MTRLLKGSRRKILIKSMELFASRGTPGIKMSDVAAFAGLSRGTVYRNIAATPPLFDQVADFHAAELREMASAICDAERDIPLRHAMFILQCMRRAEHEPFWCRYVLRYSIVDPQVFRALDEALGRLGSEGTTRETSTGVNISRREVAFDLFAGMQAIRFGDSDWREAGLTCLRRSFSTTALPSLTVEGLLKKYL
jgi:AcrR family transcriptional regulator